VHNYIVLDGPIDAHWIENLNTVLDDNKVLCLANGERLRMNPTMRIIFENENFKFSTPATVSRLGIVQCEPLSWNTLFMKWKNVLTSEGHPESQTQMIFEIVESYLPTILKHANAQEKELELNSVKSLLNLWKTYIGKDSDK
jgi:dynein heavy chain